MPAPVVGGSVELGVYMMGPISTAGLAHVEPNGSVDLLFLEHDCRSPVLLDSDPNKVKFLLVKDLSVGL